jgi:DNA topoisomerase I
MICFSAKIMPTGIKFLVVKSMFLLTEDISVSSSKIKSILGSPVKSAEAANLVYVTDTFPGFRRLKRGKCFVYLYGDKKVTDSNDLKRIKSLVIPPAWQNVWICSLDNGHLQATGYDIKKRKQYRYHNLWSTLRNQTKYYRLYSIGKALPLLRQKLEYDLSLPGMPLNKVLATIVSLMEQTCIRVGNSMYEKLYGSYGLTTLKNKHVKIEGDEIHFIFKGKKGIPHKIDVRSRRLSQIVRKCKDIPGKELFQFIDGKGRQHCVDSGMVNHYIKEVTGENFTAKDFRTWSGSVHALKAFKQFGCCDTITGTKRNIVNALDIVAKHLGNTRIVCKRYYVHPAIISLYENNKLEKYLKKWNRFKKYYRYDLSCEEKVLMNLLEQEGLLLSQ